MPKKSPTAKATRKRTAKKTTLSDLVPRKKVKGGGINMNISKIASEYKRP